MLELILRVLAGAIREERSGQEGQIEKSKEVDQKSEEVEEGAKESWEEIEEKEERVEHQGG
jgi:hypothetical protein